MTDDDLKQILTRLARLEAVALRPTRTLRWPIAARIGEIVFGILLVAIAAPFWIAHRGTPHLLIAGLSLHVYAIAMMISAGIRIHMLVGFRLDEPVVTMQLRMARIRRVQVTTSLALGLAWWVLWIPCFMILFMSWGVDVFARAPAWFYISLAIGFAGIAGSIAAAKRWPRVFTHAGWHLERASREIDELARISGRR